MSVIDIRKDAIISIRAIKFAEVSDDGAYQISKFEDVCIEDEATCLTIKTKEDAENLIKALQKAIELNWWEE